MQQWVAVMRSFIAIIPGLYINADPGARLLQEEALCACSLNTEVHGVKLDRVERG